MRRKVCVFLGVSYLTEIKPGMKVRLGKRRYLPEWAKGGEAIIMHQAVKAGVFDPDAHMTTGRIRYDPIDNKWAVAVFVPEVRDGYLYADVWARDIKVLSESTV